MSDLLDQYRRDGFVVAKGLFSDAELDQVATSIRDVFEARLRSAGVASQSARGTLSDTITALFNADQSAYIAAAKQTQYLLSATRLGLSDSVLEVLKELGISLPAFSTRLVIFYMSDALRIERGYHKTPIHQDWRSIQGSLDGIILWVPLSNVGLNDYPLEVIPGSHRFGLLPTVDDVFGHRVADGQVDEQAFRPLTVTRGDAVLFSGFVVHRTGVTGGPECRATLSFRYNNLMEPHFVARNFPSPYVYYPDFKLLTEGFPTSEDIEVCFAPEGDSQRAEHSQSELG